MKVSHQLDLKGTWLRMEATAANAAPHTDAKEYTAASIWEKRGAATLQPPGKSGARAWGT